MTETSETHPIVLTTSRGLDELLQSEVISLLPDAQPRLKPGQILLDATLRDAYTLCLWSRLANRVIWVLSEGDSDTEQQLYETARSIDWTQHLKPGQPFVVSFSGTNREINNSQYGAQRVKDAVVDCFEDADLARPNVDKINPQVLIQARLWRDKILIGIDLSGKSLHQRGYRTEAGEAPLKEHVASAVLIRSGWTKDTAAALIDPMCGSGTLAIEAAQIATHRAPGLLRSFWGFTGWRGHNPEQWSAVLSAAQQAVTKPSGPIYASDNQVALIAIAKRNADKAGVFDVIEFSHQDALKLSAPKTQAGYIVSNPPYGERLSDMASLVPFFADFGAHLKENFADWRVSLLTSQRDLLRQMKLRASNEYALMNGKLDCKLVNFVLDEQNLETRAASVGQEFANRVKKNMKQLQRFLKQNDTNAYRIYDADLPDYNVAIDVYANWLVVQEYAPPKNIPAEKAQRRLNDIIIQLPSITGVAPENIALKVRSQQKGKRQYEKVASEHNLITVYENGAEFYINPTDYLDCGLFLDHRKTRQIVAQKARRKDVLNLFAYTGSVSVMCAKAGARSVTTVDLSKTYLDWAKRNFTLNNLSLRGAFRFEQADCLNWFSEHTATFDLMFIDPPSFSNSKRMESTWDVQRDHVALLTQAFDRLNQGGEIVFSTNLRQFKMDTESLEAVGFTLENISTKTLPEDFKRNPKIHQCWVLAK
ncbi:bifunctional 23S rRNA (guanine(2069)-N(7))-methyltransferase RlmK/23S rRNA (guanine(2445)-N(2))-methyltransferase RlmL [Alteromonas oceanisediminis]|uniref:bifunctional 23S rRNA (guanine(2069)-N(7))-methyltransferase RlmK/23S rRNA (guanine(2445)-N(2))-methyltransferase RlmL n=1 Tax=Alteromonas oceanisediminis TaxID=2836180 RepID=UPI001BDAC621|nr:bifunctional 23S rRNA (guanine(2069)-N(7))-methyltransferase RlmK/23S rRNA (guanine(2445)-N(2))-methyltransferase RlmL [Alteromonas oceanisediminis]MBT0587113.1 bifunctional 23S rRNA (guanine(2069)-N(7))-methyltransferase RlmK/23S rRNA (guanine(2445)-N(2))-methyltransferase RlmL [Alteromonas oceanisediminis]